MNVELYWKLCCVCLKESEELNSIFEKDENGKSICEKIEECADITLSTENNDPIEICKKCRALLSISYKFRITCRNSNEILRKLKDNVIAINDDTIDPTDHLLVSNNFGSEDESAVGNEWDPIKEVEDEVLNKTKTVSEERTRRNSAVPKSPESKSKLLQSSCKRLKTIPDSDADEAGTEGKSRKNKSVHICHICGNTYDKGSRLEFHLRWHRNERPHQCELCKKSFSLKITLTRHMRRHTGEKPFECRFCSRRFAENGARQKHERTHTGERPYACNDCGKTFTYSHVLKAHQLTHTGEKHYSCEECGKQFTRPHHLKAHLSTLIHQNSAKKMLEISKVPAKIVAPKSNCVEFVSTGNVDENTEKYLLFYKPE